ncbi:MAG: CoA-binding protein [Gemmatimonadetes bacterium]|nr:CoA-binding protein [Gemmatimonadota bacterium]
MPNQNPDCELPDRDGSPEEIRALLGQHKVVAVVGLSSDERKPSYRVAAYLQSAGYRIVPIHPKATEILGMRAFPSLRDVPAEIGIEIVDLFRRPEALPAHVEEAIDVGARVVWFQEGIVNNEAAAWAAEAGLTVVQNRCMLKEHKML